MRSLFLRIFLWFWVAMVAVAVLLAISSPFFTRSRPGLTRWQHRAEAALNERLAVTARRVEAGESAPAGPWRPDPHRPQVFVLSPAGTALEGPPPPPEIAAFARRVAAADEKIAERQGADHLLGRPVASPGGSTVIVVAAARRPPHLVDLLEPRALGWRLVLLVVLVGALCLWLARQLSAPVVALQTAVRRLAAGDLAARADRRLVTRRDDIGALARDVDTMAERLQALVGAQRRLLSDVSHELRSPLARLRVALELAGRHPGHDDTATLGRIEREADRLEGLVAQLLTLSRLEAATAPASSDIVDLAELAREVGQDAAFEATPRKVRVAVVAPDPLPVVGDGDALASAVENVVRNAVAFTPDGGTVEVGVARDGNEVVVRIADAGPGVPEDALGALFDPFYRVEEARDRGHGGTGLGLAIAARAARLHGGSVTARNRPEGGLEVALRVPCAPPGDARTGTATKG